jgi:sigma-B regulation protein RsbU (phosphoserine phosphatase)
MNRKNGSTWVSDPLLCPHGPSVGSGPVHVGEAPLRLGRDPGCDVVVPEPTVSRRHARLFWHGGELLVEDLGSSTGTFVNEAKVQRATLAPGDVIRLGPHIEFTVEVERMDTPLEAATRRTVGEEGVKHLQTLLEVARALDAATVLQEVVSLVLQAAIRLLRADRGCVVLLEGEGRKKVVAQYPADQGEAAWAQHSSLLDQAIAGRHTVTAGIGVSPSTSMFDRGATIAVATPLTVARRPVGRAEEASFVATVEVIGGIVLERGLKGEPFGHDELAVFESLAREAAQAIDSARLYRAAREKAKSDYEMSLARTIQAALLLPPPEPPFAEVFTYSQPARSVGGDLFHGAMRQDGGLAVALGDVSGKGVPAALTMAVTQGILGLLHDLNHPMAELLPALNRSLERYNPGNRFVTLTLGVLFPDGRIDLVNAGHCPIAVVRADGVSLLKPRGPVLGLLPQASWTMESLTLADGDAVVFYSDGISESFSPSASEFGVEGVRAALIASRGSDARAIGRAVLDAAANHRAGREAEDDVTLLVLRYRAPSTKPS